MNNRNIGICSYILHYRDYSHDKLYIEIQSETWKFTPDGERQPHELCQWYVGKGYCKYCGVRVIVDGQEASEPIISKEMKDTHDVRQHLNEFMIIFIKFQTVIYPFFSRLNSTISYCKDLNNGLR